MSYRQWYFFHPFKGEWVEFSDHVNHKLVEFERTTGHHIRIDTMVFDLEKLHVRILGNKNEFAIMPRFINKNGRSNFNPQEKERFKKNQNIQHDDQQQYHKQPHHGYHKQHTHQYHHKQHPHQQQHHHKQQQHHHKQHQHQHRYTNQHKQDHKMQQYYTPYRPKNQYKHKQPSPRVDANTSYEHNPFVQFQTNRNEIYEINEQGNLYIPVLFQPKFSGITKNSSQNDVLVLPKIEQYLLNHMKNFRKLQTPKDITHYYKYKFKNDINLGIDCFSKFPHFTQEEIVLVFHFCCEVIMTRHKLVSSDSLPLLKENDYAEIHLTEDHCCLLLCLCLFDLLHIKNVSIDNGLSLKIETGKI